MNRDRNRRVDPEGRGDPPVEVGGHQHGPVDSAADVLCRSRSAVRARLAWVRTVGRTAQVSQVMGAVAVSLPRRYCAVGRGTATVAELRRQDDHYLAAFLEMTSAGPLLGIGRFEQVDTAVTALADRYRRHGPPTLRHWALQSLGYSASFQGRPEDADRYFDEAARVDLPAGTLSANKTTEARSAFRRGERLRAFQLLRSHIDELIDTDNVIAASVVCIEFINMMAAIDRIVEAAHLLRYLRSANDFGALAARTLVTEATRKIAAAVGHGSEPTPTSVPSIDDRAALGYMRDVLGKLAGPSAHSPS